MNELLKPLDYMIRYDEGEYKLCSPLTYSGYMLEMANNLLLQGVINNKQYRNLLSRTKCEWRILLKE